MRVYTERRTQHIINISTREMLQICLVLTYDDNRNAERTLN